MKQIAEGCNCHAEAGSDVALDPLEDTYQRLRRVEDSCVGSESVADHLLQCIKHGDGITSSMFQLIAQQGDVARYAQEGDVVIAAPRFADEEPRIEVVDAPWGWDQVAESLTNRHERLYLLRPSSAVLGQSESGGYAENPGALAAVGTAASGLGIAKQVVDLGQGVTQIQRDRLALTNERLDFAMRVAKIGDQVRQSLRGLDFSSQPATLASRGYTPPNAETRASVYEFQLLCRYSANSSDRARYTFRVNVQHDCFNIIRASVVPGTFDLGGFTVRSHMLTLSVQPQPGEFRAAFPGEIRFNLSGRWDPADVLGRVAEGISGSIVVRADGRVRLSGVGGGLVSASRLRLIRGPGTVGSCQALYQSIQGQQAPAPVPGRAQASGQGRRASSYQSRPNRHPDPLPQDPPNGKHLFFLNGGSHVTQVHRTRVRNWWTQLGPNRQQAISAGQVQVVINGHADPTGSSRGNIALSGRRANNVAALVRELAGNQARIDVRGVGASVAQQNGVRGRSPAWRRATIRVAGL